MTNQKLKLMQDCLGYKRVNQEIKLLETGIKFTNGNIILGYRKWLLNNFKYFTKVDVKESKRLSENAQVKRCYHNCFNEMTDSRFKYFEGYTWTEEIPIPLEHCWLVKDDQVIDPTLAINVKNITNRLGDEYLGVEIPKDFVFKKAVKVKKSGPFIFDYYNEVVRK